MKYLIVLFLILSGLLLALQEEDQPLEGRITFKINNAGIPVEGTITGLRGSIRLSPDSTMYLAVEADPSTIDTGIALRDAHLQRPDYFNVKSFPRIRVVSKSIKRLDQGRYQGNFILYLKQMQFPLTLQLTENEASGELRTTFVLNRLDFDLGTPSLILSDSVYVKALIYRTK